MKTYYAYAFSCHKRASAAVAHCKEWCGDQDKCIVALREFPETDQRYLPLQDGTAAPAAPEATKGNGG